MWFVRSNHARDGVGGRRTRLAHVLPRIVYLSGFFFSSVPSGLRWVCFPGVLHGSAAWFVSEGRERWAHV